jgi:DNA-binding transcriptional ArsR family regulator
MFKLLTATVQDECSCSIRSAWKCSSRLVRYDNCVELGPDVALIAGLMGEPARAAMLVALVNGRALAAGELAFIGNVAPQTASFHLRKLMDASLLVVEKHGKHSYYRLANEQVATTLESIAALAPLRKVADLRARAQSQSARFNELRFARSCYRHLAGMLAVEINQALLHRALLIADSETTYCLTDLGLEWCRQLGMSIPKPALQRKLLSRACVDWTERRHHLGGALGAALFSRLSELRWIVKNPQTRTVRITHAGARGLEMQLGITISSARL